MNRDPDFELSLAERYARYLFDSMPGVPGIGYRNHTWNHCELRYETEDEYELRVPITLSDTHQSVERKLRAAHERAREEAEYERIEAEEIVEFEIGFFFQLIF